MVGADDAGGWRAIKIVRRDRFDDDRAYEREYNGIRHYAPVSLEEPTLLRILHCGRRDAEGYFYYVMELADDASGSTSFDPETYLPRTLKLEKQRQGRLPPAVCLDIGLEVAGVLGALHARGLVHRDVKPSNIIFVRGEARLADLGLVTALDHTLSLDAATLGFVPPEGGGAPQADLYALGKVLYEIATGEDRLSFPKLPDLRALPAAERKGILELNRIFLKACANKARDRYPDAAAMIADLKELREGVSLRLRHQLRIAVLGTAAVLLLAATFALGRGFLVWSREQARLPEVMLGRARLQRTGERESGWSDRVWSNAFAASRIRLEAQTRNECAASLAGLDARLMHAFTNVAGTSAAFAKDGSLLLAGTTNTPLQLISPAGTRAELPARGEGPVGWTPDGTPVQVVAGTDCCILREARTGRGIQAFCFPTRHVVVGENGPVLGMLPDGSRVAAVVSNGADSSVVAWETATGAVLGEVSGTASSLAFSPDGGCLACGGLEGEITVRSLPGLQPTQILRTRVWRAPVLALAFMADPLIPYEATTQTNRWLLASGNRSGAIAIWDVSAGQPRAWCRGSPYGVFSLAVHPDGLTLASAGRSEARLWDITTSQLLLRLPVPNGDAARALAFSSDGSRLAWGNEPGFQPASAGMWSLKENRGVQVLRGLGAGVRQIWFSPDSRLLAALDDNWHAAVWAVDTRRLIRLFEAPLGMVADNAGGAFDATGTRFAFATWQEARLYDLRSGSVLDRWTLPEGFADSLQFDPGGRLLLVRREA